MRILLTTGITIGVILSILIGCQQEVDIKTAQYAVNGQKVYRTHCQNCHGEKGEGLGNLYPPLTDTTFLQTHRQDLACIIKNGTSGELEVAGKKFNNTMPASNLSAIDIAYVLTYINTKINKGKNLYPLEEVEKNLKNCK
ncbi:cytochrome C [Sphingobacterium siyangense]|uniref:Cytochrome C n=1 Tax=Sphingobacterium siyangense TaxID=459529 RepID=A0A420FWI8_9SPHI|nr:cytochrome c [Sphingobacterium siyangense]QRY55711.1 c-type cytochrome [Sphingobacterium siyangense]RKF37233.1 cytochrome C [Sphingobacterium siyangense]